jgi:hypothetical protein
MRDGCWVDAAQWAHQELTPEHEAEAPADGASQELRAWLKHQTWHCPTRMLCPWAPGRRYASEAAEALPVAASKAWHASPAFQKRNAPASAAQCADVLSEDVQWSGPAVWAARLLRKRRAAATQEEAAASDLWEATLDRARAGPPEEQPGEPEQKAFD